MSPIFETGTFDLFGVRCEQHHRNAPNTFLNGTKNGDVNGTCKQGLTLEFISVIKSFERPPDFSNCQLSYDRSLFINMDYCTRYEAGSRKSLGIV